MPLTTTNIHLRENAKISVQVYDRFVALKFADSKNTEATVFFHSGRDENTLQLLVNRAQDGLDRLKEMEVKKMEPPGNE